MSAAVANLERLPRGIQIALGLGLVALAAFPVVGSDFYVSMVTRMMVMAIFAMSLDLLQGVTGLVSLGHAAYFGLAGYAFAFLSPQDVAASLWWTLPLCVLAAAAAALLIGFFVVRTHGIYFIMVTLAFAQMVFFVFFNNKALGGSDGLYINFKPDAVLFNLDSKTQFYYFVLACTLAGGLAGVAGYLWAAQTGFVNPELMGFHKSAHTIMMLILGGMGNFAGAIIGAFAFEVVLHVFKDLSKHWMLLMGSFIVAVVIFAPRGLLGLAMRAKP